MEENNKLKHEIIGKTSVVTLDDSRNYNAFSANLINQFIKLLDSIENNEKINFVIIKANGKHFCAGANIRQMQHMSTASEEENLTDAMRFAKFFAQLNSFTKPVVALAHGKTLGGGLGLLACCDFVIAAEDAQFTFSEVKLGLIPSTIAPYVVRKIGYASAKRYFMSAEYFDAVAAKQIGLIQEICPQSELFNKAQAWLANLQKNSPKAMAAAKHLVNYVASISPVLLKDTAMLLAKIRSSSDAKEGINAFLEKRPPHWIKR